MMIIDDICNEQDSDNKATGGDKPDKTDSGMEEESNSEPLPLDESDDDGDVIVKKTANKSKSRLILDDDSDQSDNETTTTPAPQKFTAEEALQAVLHGTSDDNDDDALELTASVKKKKIKRPVDDSSDDEQNDNEDKSAINRKSQNSDDESRTNETGEEAVTGELLDRAKGEEKMQQTEDSDSSDSRSSSGSDSEHSDNNNNDDDDEGFNEESIDPKLLAKLKKGAGKQPRSKSARISKKEEMMSIHSESQRIVREGRVNLPYHQPAPKSLNDFLARASKKQQEYKSLTGSVRNTRKAKVIEDVLQNTRLQTKTITQEELDKYSDSDEDWDPHKTDSKTLLERVAEKLQDTVDKTEQQTAENGDLDSAENDKQESDNIGEQMDVSQASEKSNSVPDENLSENKLKSDQEQVKVVSMSEDSQDSLPELYVEKETVKKSDKEKTDEEKTLPDLIVSESTEKDNLGETVCEQSTSDDLLYEWEKTGQDSENNLQNSNEAEGSNMEVTNENNETSSENLAENKENVNEDNVAKQNETSKVSPSQTSSTDAKLARKLKKEKLLALAGIDLNVVKPCLSGETDSFISLVEAEEPPKHPGVVKLMDRLTKHTAKKEKKKSRDMDISIVSKNTVGMDKEELKLNTFTYHIEEEDSNPLMKLETPGAKLLALKEQLQEKIKEKREEARQKRQELYNLDNEEGDFGAEEEEEMSEHSDTDVDEDQEFNDQFGGDYDDEEEMITEKKRKSFLLGMSKPDRAEEEEEMSEHSDTDVDEDQEFNDQFGGDYDDEEEMITEKKRKKNKFADEEAYEDGEDDEYGDENDDDADDQNNADDDNENDADDEDIEDEDDLNLKLDVSGEEEEDSVDAAQEKQESTDKQENNGELEEESDTRDVQDFKEPDSTKKLPDKPFSMFGQKSSSRDIFDTQLQSGQKVPSLRLQIEDSQDLYGTLPQLAPTQEPSMSQSSQHNYNFLLEDSQSVMLDAEGYLKTKSTSKKKSMPKISSAFNDLSSTQDDMDVLGLCSGKFVTQVEGKDKTSKKSLFDDNSVSNTQNMEDFIGLCSGVFTESKASSSQTQSKKRKASTDDDNDSIEALSDNEARNSDKDDESENEEDHDTDDVGQEEGEEDGETGETEETPQQFTGFLQKRGKIRKEFVEEEAELSGSEYDSDENLDLPEEEDIMEIEEADKEVANIDQEQLRDEVGRVHLKQLIDEDKRELLRFQEMYLADGDLHSEGGGRMRRFRWSNMDDDTQQDMFGDGSDDEGHEQDDTEELQWRKERYEREKFLKDQQDKEYNDSENSQFLKFGKVFLKRQESVDTNSSKRDQMDQKSGDATSGNQADTPGFPGSFYKLSKQKRGSFLARSKEALAKIAEMTKPVTNPSAGAKSSGKFTFQVISPGKEKGTEASPARKERKAHKPTQSADAGFKKPPMKRQKVDAKVKPQSSIFNHL